MKIKLLLLVVCIQAASASLMAQITLSDFPRPCGIYSLGTLAGGANDILDLPFVDGFVMRYDWASLETARGIYDFTTVDQVVRKLDSLGQGLTFTLFRMKVPPYILNTSGVETYTLTTGSQTFQTAVPWDPYANERFRALMDTVSNHEVFSIRDNRNLKLKDHPVLKQVDGSPIGMNGIRDLNNQLIPLPSYNRLKFVKSVTGTAQDVVSRFPKQFVFLAIFGISDQVGNPTLTTFLRDTLMQVFNRGTRPRLGFFQENLACSTPIGSTNNTLFLKRDSTFTMNQMLQAWQNPFLNPQQTDVCLTANGGPDVSILYGLATFKCTYFEIYKVDLLHNAYQDMFTRMQDTLHFYCPKDTAVTVYPPETEISIYPNPARNNLTIRFGNIPDEIYALSVFSSAGQLLHRSLLNQQFNMIDIRKFSAGSYFLKLSGKTEIIIRKILVY